MKKKFFLTFQILFNVLKEMIYSSETGRLFRMSAICCRLIFDEFSESSEKIRAGRNCSGNFLCNFDVIACAFGKTHEPFDSFHAAYDSRCVFMSGDLLNYDDRYIWTFVTVPLSPLLSRLSSEVAYTATCVHFCIEARKYINWKIKLKNDLFVESYLSRNSNWASSVRYSPTELVSTRRLMTTSQTA